MVDNDNMTDNDIGIYNEIVQERFPDVQIVQSDAEYVFALGVTSEEGRIFHKFVVNELGDLLRSRGLKYWGVMTFSIQATQKKFPDIWQKIQMKKRFRAIFQDIVKQDVLKTDSRWFKSMASNETDSLPLKWNNAIGRWSDWRSQKDLVKSSSNLVSPQWNSGKKEADAYDGVAA